MLQLPSDDSSTDAFVGITAWKGSVKSLLCILVTSLGWESAHEADFLWKLFIACWIIAVTNRIASIFFFQEKCGQYWLTNSFTTVGENKNKLLRKANATVCVCSCCLKPWMRSKIILFVLKKSRGVVAWLRLQAVRHSRNLDQLYRQLYSVRYCLYRTNKARSVTAARSDHNIPSETNYLSMVKVFTTGGKTVKTAGSKRGWI